jgi:tubulin---tyrosine ligase
MEPKLRNHKNPMNSPTARDLTIIKRNKLNKSRAKTSKANKSNKTLFEEESLKKDPKLRARKSPIPSYFKRHFQHEKFERQSSSKIETVSRLTSPVSFDLKINKNPEKLPVNLVINLLQSSNGIELHRVIEPNYKFFVGPGNNDLLVNKLIKSKPGWVKVFSPHSANLIWTDVKKKSVFELIPKSFNVKKTPVKPKEFEISVLPKTEYVALAVSSVLNPLKTKIYNKLEGNSELASKKKLFINMYNYYKSINEDPFNYIPLSFHLTNGTKDINYSQFLLKFQEFQTQIQFDPYLNNCWIIKPGEATNRGIGISVCSTISEISACIDEKKTVNKIPRTYIIQKYLYKPLLYNNRKFDIRCYLLVTNINTNIQAYFYKEGYLRTSCTEFNMSNIQNKFIHLTNDAIQKKSPDYGKFEDGNKLSYDTFQAYIDSSFEKKVDFKSEIYPAMKEIVKDTIKATYKSLDPSKRLHSFEIFGYDFMLDELYKPWLIEVNTNPCLSLSGKYLATLIPTMLNDAFNITLDQIFPQNSYSFENNLFELIFSENKC